MNGKNTNTPKKAPSAAPASSAAAEKQQEGLDAKQKLQNLRQVIEKRINEGDPSADLPQQLENLKRLEAKTQKEALTAAEEQEISEKYEKLDAIEKQIAESDDVQKEMKPVPEKPKDFMSNIGTMIEHYRNFFAYHLAPILASLKNIPLFGGDSTVTMIETFLGMEKTMLFAALREKQIDPVFHPDDPRQDTKAIDKMIEMAKKIHTTNSTHTIRGFFDSATLSFANHLEKTTSRKTFALQELAEFTEKNVYEQELNLAKKDKAAEVTVALPPLGTKVELKTENGETVATYGNVTYSFKAEGGEVLFKDKNNAIKKRKLVAVTNFGDVAITINELKMDGGNLSLTATPPTMGEAKPIKHTLDQATMEKLMINVTQGTRYDFSIETTDEKTKEKKMNNLSFTPA